MLGYPPCTSMLKVLGLSKDEGQLSGAMKELAAAAQAEGVTVLGPAPDFVRYVQDTFRMVLYCKAKEREKLKQVKDRLEQFTREGVSVQFEFSE